MKTDTDKLTQTDRSAPWPVLSHDVESSHRPGPGHTTQPQRVGDASIFRTRLPSPLQRREPKVCGNQAGCSRWRFFVLPPKVQPLRVVFFHLRPTRSRLYCPGPGLQSADILGVHVGKSYGSEDLSFPNTDQFGTLLIVGCEQPTALGSLKAISSFLGGSGCKQGRTLCLSQDHFGAPNFPLRPTVLWLYAPGSGALGCSEVLAGVQVPIMRSRFVRSGDVMLHTGRFLRFTSSCQTYWPGAGVLLDLAKNGCGPCGSSSSASSFTSTTSSTISGSNVRPSTGGSEDMAGSGSVPPSPLMFAR